MIKFSFVILHYKTDEDTKACIESIKRLAVPANVEMKIVVVDNASNNGSIEKVESLFGEDDDVILIKNNENLGFARGNNVGYVYARETLKADYIAVLNNDIVVDSKDIIEKSIALFEEYSYGVMGPDIESMVDGGHQNPGYKTGTDIGVLKADIKRMQRLLLLSKLHVYDFLQKRFGTEKTPATVKAKQENPETGIQLHGSFLLFSPIYVKAESYAFYPKTFLYCEEAILYNHCLDKGYITLYHPCVRVFHKEDSSTSFATQTNKKKREFVFKNYIDSHKVYIEFLENKGLWN